MKCLSRISKVLCFGFLVLSFWSCKKDQDGLYAGADDPALRQLLATPASQRYYWYQEQKLFFDWDTERYVLDIKGEADQLDSVLALLGYNGTYHRLDRDPLIARLILDRPAVSDLLPKLNDGLDVLARYPAIKLLNQSGSGVSFITDEISIKFEGETGVSELTAFAEKHSLEHLSQTDYGAHLFRSKDRMRTLAITNFIHENEPVEWSNPNFLALISLWGAAAGE